MRNELEPVILDERGPAPISMWPDCGLMYNVGLIVRKYTYLDVYDNNKIKYYIRVYLFIYFLHFGR